MTRSVTWSLPCFGISLLLVGCATPVYNYAPTDKVISVPPVGETRTVVVGDNMLHHGAQSEQSYLYVEEEVRFGTVLHPFTLGKGLYLKVGEDEESAFFEPENHFEGGGMLRRSPLADPTKAVQAYTNENKLCGISVFRAQLCNDEAKYRLVTRSTPDPRVLQRLLIYNGKIGEQIQIAYAESGPASVRNVTNVISYDLSDSNIVRFKEVRIEILESTRESVTYRILSGFD